MGEGIGPLPDDLLGVFVGERATPAGEGRREPGADCCSVIARFVLRDESAVPGVAAISERARLPFILVGGEALRVGSASSASDSSHISIASGWTSNTMVAGICVVVERGFVCEVAGGSEVRGG